MKKRTGLRSIAMVGAVTLALTLAACSSNTPATNASATTLSGSIRVAFGVGSQQAPMDKIVANFEKTHPGTKINVDYLPANSIAQTIVTQLRAGNGPDVFYSNGGSGQAYSVLPLGKAGTTADLNGDWTKTLPDAAKPLFQVDGRTYGLPLAEVVIGMIYDRDALKKIGAEIPTNIDDFVKVCEKAKSNNVSAVAVAGTVPINLGVIGQAIAASYVYSKHPDWNVQRADGKSTFADTAEWKQALEVVNDLKKNDCIVSGSEGAAVPQTISNVASGKALMLPGPAGAIDAVKQAGAKAEFGVIPFPGANADDTRAVVGYTDALAVNAKSSNIALAKAFIDFFAQPDQAQIYADGVSAVSLSDAAKGNVPDKVSDFGPYLKAGHVVGLPNQGWPNAAVNDAFASGIQGLLTGQKKPDEILSAMDSAWGK